jgi:capsular polysaccharide transport system permease protein
MPPSGDLRSPADVTLSVWRALLLREALSRISRERAAWIWLLLEPVVHVVFLVFVLIAVRMRVVGGIDTVIWALVGLTAFFMFRRPAQQAMNAVGMNQALFGYRQVKPVDTVLVRAALEGFMMTVISVLLYAGAGLVGFDMLPDDPMMVLTAMLGLWLAALGFGLIMSVASELLPELGRLVGLIMTPLYFFSGVMFPIARLPSTFRDWLALNPIAHGLEAARLGFASHYRAIPELSVAYLYGCALAAIFLGLVLHRRFALNLAAR